MHVGKGVGQGKGHFLHRGRASLADVVAADRNGIPLRQVVPAVGKDIRHQPQRGPGRIDVSSPGDVLLEDVVLYRAGETAGIGALPLGHRHVESQQDGGGSVDGHRGGNFLQWDALEERLHILQRIDGHAHFSHFAERFGSVGVVPKLGGQVESNRQTGLALLEQVAKAAVGLSGGGVAGVLPHGPQAAAIHGGVHTAGVRKLARLSEVAIRILAGGISFPVAGLDSNM